MLIGIDASRAVKSYPTGTEYYSQEIIKHLAKLDYQNEYILYAPRLPVNDWQLPKNFHFKIMPFPKLWSQLRLSWELAASRQPPNVIFEPAHTIPLIHPHPHNMVVTIHDLGFKHFPELYTPFERWYHNFSADFSIRHSAYIIAVSQYTKQDILKNYQIDPRKVSVIYHGFDSNIFRPATSYDQKQFSIFNWQFSIRQPYILFIGRLEEKKNIVNAIEAFRIFKEKYQAGHQLVLAGKPGYGYDRIEELLNRLPPAIRRDIILPGYVELITYATLFKNAAVFFFPSNFEGFGLPVLEAMAVGIPVTCSNVTSLPEIVGEAAILFDPGKPKEMAKALEKIVTSPKLQRQLIANGLKQAQKFSWVKAAKETLSIFKEINQRSPKVNSRRESSLLIFDKLIQRQ